MPRIDRCIVIASFIGLVSTAAAEPLGLQKTEFIFDAAPFASCHGSTIVETRGNLLAAWFGGTAEGKPDVGIWISRNVEGKWTPPVEVANGIQYQKADGTQHRHPCWNPVLFQPREGPCLLFYKVGPSPSGWWGMLTTSEDGGKTWSMPRRLPERIDGPAKNKPVQLANDDILCPASTETSGWHIHIERTRDLGQTWQRMDDLNRRVIRAIQPSLLSLGGEKLLAVGRTAEGKLFQIGSDDLGKSWGQMSLGTLPNPNSGIDAVTLKDGRQLLVYNHASKGRSPLNVAISKDGVEWNAALVLEDEPGEYSYPAVIQTADDLVHVTYTWKRERIKHVVIDPAKLVARPIPNGEWPNEK